VAIPVLGLGNVLMGDDGLGPAVIRAFEDAYDAGPNVDLVDVGTPGLDLSPWLTDADRVVIVDTVKSELPPGTVRRYDKADLLRHAPAARVGPHDPGVKEALLALDFAGRGPREVTLIGVVPSRTELSLDLSPDVAAAVPAALRAIVDELARWGERVTPRCAGRADADGGSRNRDANPLRRPAA
jgi:hydrogenase maturation protease